MSAHADRLLELAERAKPCQCDPPGSGCAPCGLHMQGKEHSPECEGGCKDGEVPRYPTLRLDCPCIRAIDVADYRWTMCGECVRHDTGQKNIAEGHGDWCEHCHGRGWMPVDDTDATLEAIQSLDALSAQLIIGKDFLVALDIQGKDEVYRKIRERANTPNEALILALFKADIVSGRGRGNEGDKGAQDGAS